MARSTAKQAPADLVKRAEGLGIAPSWRDIWKKEHPVPAETLEALIAAMDIDGRSTRERAGKSAWLLPPVAIVPAEKQALPLVSIPRSLEGWLDWRVETEDGQHYEGRVATGALERRRGGRVLPLPAELAEGYHLLAVSIGGLETRCRLIVAPPSCYLPEDEGQLWGLALQVYSLRSETDWGIGDFTDLGEIGAGAGKAGAALIGTNPLHTLFAADPARISPYSPSSRQFLNPLYLDIAAVPEFAESETARRLVETSGFQKRLAAARKSELVDHPAVAALKSEAMAVLWPEFRARHLEGKTARGKAFRAFREQEGEAFTRFARFHALQSHFGLKKFDWRQWPAAYRDAKSAEVAQFAEEHADAVGALEFQLWEADRQLGLAEARAKKGGLSVGFYRDFAVGLDPSGADPWTSPEDYLTGASVGAPPDLLNRQGQNWGLTAFSPRGLRTSGYAPFIAAIRANMRHAGALRIDHVMGLRHLYLVPDGVGADKGAYIQYPLDDLLRILALESRRNRCLVVGEDLGTVPPGFRAKLARANVLSYRLLMFERRPNGGFKTPESYPPLAAASVGTHDLPTFKGWWQGRDIDWREKLGLYADAAAAREERSARDKECRVLLATLRRAGLLDETLFPPGSEKGETRPDYSYALALAVHRFLARSPCRLMLVQPEDILEEAEAVNFPGTVDEHPNWRRRLPVTVSALLADDRFKRMAALFEKETTR